MYQYTVLKTNKTFEKFFPKVLLRGVKAVFLPKHCGKEQVICCNNGHIFDNASPVKCFPKQINSQYYIKKSKCMWTMTWHSWKYYTDRLDNGWKRLYRSIGQWVEKSIQIDWTMGGKYYTDRLDNGWKRL